MIMLGKRSLQGIFLPTHLWIIIDISRWAICLKWWHFETQSSFVATLHCLVLVIKTKANLFWDNL